MPEVAGDAGIFVNPESELEICNALLQMSNDRTLHKVLSQRALKEAERYDWDVSATKLFSLLAAHSSRQ